MHALASKLRRAMLPAALLAATTSTHAQTTFIKIADTDTAIPGGSGTFPGFGDSGDAPVIDRGLVAFVSADNLGSTAESRAIYTAVLGGPVELIANSATPAPGTVPGVFSHYSQPSADGRSRRVAFEANNGGRLRGIYTSSGGSSIATEADTTTTVPGTATSFGSFLDPSLDSDTPPGAAPTTAFRANPMAIYKSAGGVVETLVELGDTVPCIPPAVPGTCGVFAAFRDPTLHSDAVVFTGGTATASDGGIYMHSGGVTNALVDRTTLIPGRATTFSFFGVEPSLDDDTVSFWGSGAVQGIYTVMSGSAPVLVADAQTPVPDGTGNFTGFGNRITAIDKRAVVFVGAGPGQQGIYTNFGGALIKVVDRGDTLDGKALTNALFQISREAISNGVVVFSVTFNDGSGTEGVFAARLPGSIMETHIDFDYDADGVEIPHLAVIDDEYAAIGVHFSGGYRIGRTSTAFPTYSVRPSLNYLCTWGGTVGGGNPDCAIPDGGDVPLGATLDFEAVFASIEAYTRNDGVYDSDALRIEGFDINGVSVGVGTAQCDNDPSPYTTESICVAYVSAPGIRRIEVSRIDFPDAMDSMWITPAAESSVDDGDSEDADVTDSDSGGGSNSDGGDDNAESSQQNALATDPTLLAVVLVAWIVAMRRRRPQAQENA